MKLKNARRSKRRTTKGNGLVNGPVILLGSIGALVLSLVVMQQLSPSAQNRRALSEQAKLAQNQANAANTAAQLVSNDLQANIDEAHRRYTSGCVMPTEATTGGAYAYKASILEEGVAVINPATGLALGDGQWVCDDRGMTYVIVDGVTALPARASDMELVNKRFDDSIGWNKDARRSDTFLTQPTPQ